MSTTASSTAAFERLYDAAYPVDAPILAIAAQLLSSPALGGDVDRLGAIGTARRLHDAEIAFERAVLDPRSTEIWRRERRQGKNFLKQAVIAAISGVFLSPPGPGPGPAENSP
jgi:hypothetical protein